MGQHIAALLLGLKSLEHDCGASGSARLTLQSLHAIAENIGHDLHQIAVELRPTSLDDHGLAHALTTFLEEWSIMSRIAVDFDPVSLGAARMPPHIELILFRVVRDALQSVLGAPGATHVSVILKRERGGGAAIIEDLGTRQVVAGKPALARDNGLANIIGRDALLGGRLTIERRAGGGTTVFARLPLPRTATAA